MLLNNLLGSALAFSQERDERILFFFFFRALQEKFIISSMAWRRGQTLTAWPPCTTSCPAAFPCWSALHWKRLPRLESPSLEGFKDLWHSGPWFIWQGGDQPKAGPGGLGGLSRPKWCCECSLGVSPLKVRWGWRPELHSWESPKAETTPKSRLLRMVCRAGHYFGGHLRGQQPGSFRIKAAAVGGVGQHSTRDPHWWGRGKLSLWRKKRKFSTQVISPLFLSKKESVAWIGNLPCLFAPDTSALFSEQNKWKTSLMKHKTMLWLRLILSKYWLR